MLLKAIARAFCLYHNKIQLVGYEAANIVLFAYHASAASSSHSLEHMLAATAFLCGSSAIFFFDPENRPAMLFYGGIGLTAGGAFLVAAGHPLTGAAVVLASLETARGGLGALNGAIAGRIADCRAAGSLARVTSTVGGTVLYPYTVSVTTICQRFRSLGRFIDQRPFVTGALIKLPLRLDMVVRSLVLGDLVSAAVALSWMLLGDGALAFNDDKLRSRVSSWAASPARSRGAMRNAVQVKSGDRAFSSAR